MVRHAEMSTPKIRNMEEFAAFSGVSRPTVSRFFHDPESVRQSTRDKLEKALKLPVIEPTQAAASIALGVVTIAK